MALAVFHDVPGIVGPKKDHQRIKAVFAHLLPDVRRPVEITACGQAGALLALVAVETVRVNFPDLGDGDGGHSLHHGVTGK